MARLGIPPPAEKYAFVLLFLIPAFFVLESDLRWVVLLVVLPFTLIWAIYFSYDTRNLALALPFIGGCAGVGLQRFTSLGLQALARLKLLAVRMALLAGCGCRPRGDELGRTDSALQQQKPTTNSDFKPTQRKLSITSPIRTFIAFSPTIRGLLPAENTGELMVPRSTGFRICKRPVHQSFVVRPTPTRRSGPRSRPVSRGLTS